MCPYLCYLAADFWHFAQPTTQLDMTSQERAVEFFADAIFAQNYVVFVYLQVVRYGVFLTA